MTVSLPLRARRWLRVPAIPLRRSARSSVRAARDPDLPLVRRVRWRLIAWSAGSTLVVLAILGTLLYASVAARLRDESVAQLRERATLLQTSHDMRTMVRGALVRIDSTNDPTMPGVAFGGPASGTIAFAIGLDELPLPVPKMTVERPTGIGVTRGAGGVAVPPATTTPADKLVLPLPDPATLEAARAGETVIQETSLRDTPVRMLTTKLDLLGASAIVQVIDDRTSELRALETLLFVLILGGLAVVAASIAVGYVYAGRALVPIRDSLRRQREFAADASHELRTPLAIVGRAVEQLRRRPADAETVDRSLDDIDAGAGRLNRLVDDLLLLARTDADTVELAMAPTDLGEVATDTVEGMAGLAAAREVRLRLDVEPAEITGDASRLRQLAGILVENAIRHTPAGSVVTIRVRPGADLEVEDQGPGIRSEDLPHVFDRFWQAKDAPSGGTGLGLAIASWIAQRHGGRLAAGNRLEGGARFTLSLPGG